MNQSKIFIEFVVFEALYSKISLIINYLLHKCLHKICILFIKLSNVTELHKKFSIAISGSQKTRYYFQAWEAAGTPFVNFLPGVIAALCLDKSLGLSSKFSSLEDGQRWLKVEQLWETIL